MLEYLVQTVQIHDIALIEVDPPFELLSWDFIGDYFSNPGQDVREAVGQVVNDDAFELGVLEDLDKGVGANESETAGDEQSFKLCHDVLS